MIPVSYTHLDVYKRQHDYRQNQEYQKLYAEYERTMSMSKKDRIEAGLDEFPQAPVRLSLIHIFPKSPNTTPLPKRWSDSI